MPSHRDDPQPARPGHRVGRLRGVIRRGKADVLGDDGAVVATLDKVERTSPTLGAPPPEGVRGEEGPAGPLFLQDHGNPVRYRSIWVLPSKEPAAGLPAGGAPAR